MPGWIFRLYFDYLFDPPQSSYPLLFECFVLILVWIGQCSQIHVCLNPNFIFSILAFIEILLLYIPALWNLFLKFVREREPEPREQTDTESKRAAESKIESAEFWSKIRAKRVQISSLEIISCIMNLKFYY